MKVIIVGAGEVGFHICDRLSKEGHDVTVLEKDLEKHRQLRSRVDALVLLGSGARTESLEEAGIRNADLFIAVTNLDEVNLISCMLASDYDVGRKIARIKSLEYSFGAWERHVDRLGVDLVINPDHVVADEIRNAVAHASATEVIEFADGRVVFMGYRILEDSPLAGVTLKTLGGIRGLYRMVVTTISRDEETIIPRGDDVVGEGDVVHFVCNKKDVGAITEDLFGFERRRTRNVFLHGGSRAAFEVARRLDELKCRVKVIEPDPKRCEELAESLEHARILNATGTDLETLRNEGIEQADVFIGVTEDDQTNILSSLLAKRNGCKRAIAVVSQPELVKLAPALGVDACVSPRLATASAILQCVRGGKVVNMAVVDQSNSEILEMIMPENSPILRQPLRSLSIPHHSIIGAIVRGEGVLVPDGDDHLEADDHVIVFALPDAIGQVEKYFS